MLLVKHTILFTLLSTTVVLTACNGGSSGDTPTPTPTPLDLQTYIPLLDYQPLSNNNLLAADINPVQQQMGMNLSHAITIDNITVNFYTNANCDSLAMALPISGIAILKPGTYTTTDSSNLALCSVFNYNGNTGCAYEFVDVKSMNFVINQANNLGQVSGSCMSNHDYFGELLAQYLTGSAYSRNCNQNYHCGFSQSYSIILN